MKKNYVLVAEDSEINAAILEMALRELGMKCDIVPDGQLALDKAGAVKYAAIFMDCQMPVMDGFEATLRIRELERPYSLVPIIALTSSLTEEVRNQCMESGMNHVLTKPVEQEELEPIINKYVHQRIEIDTDHRANNIIESNDVTEFPGAVERLIKELHFEQSVATSFVREFVDTAKGLVKQMEAAIERKDGAQLMKCAHQLKGIACNLRLKQIQLAVTEIEGKEKNKLEVAKEDIDILKAILNTLSE